MGAWIDESCWRWSLSPIELFDEVGERILVGHESREQQLTPTSWDGLTQCGDAPVAVKGQVHRKPQLELYQDVLLRS